MTAVSGFRMTLFPLVLTWFLPTFTVNSSCIYTFPLFLPIHTVYVRSHITCGKEIHMRRGLIEIREIGGNVGTVGTNA
jgi:hypothetical protein